MDLRSHIRALPKAELHLHLEGAIDPELMMRLAVRNKVAIPFRSADEIRAACRFTRLQDFLDLYHQGMAVLRAEEDYFELTAAYLERVADDGAVHVEVFFDPQGHTARGIPFATAADGILAALADGRERLGITSLLIMNVWRDLSEDDGFAAFRQAEPYIADRRIAGLGLDSTEMDHPPAKFERLFAAAREAGLKLVAHAGEEGPASYVAEAVDLLAVDRIDHGNRALEDPALVRRLARQRHDPHRVPAFQPPARRRARPEAAPAEAHARRGPQGHRQLGRSGLFRGLSAGQFRRSGRGARTGAGGP